MLLIITTGYTKLHLPFSRSELDALRDRCLERDRKHMVVFNYNPNTDIAVKELKPILDKYTEFQLTMIRIHISRIRT